MSIDELILTIEDQDNHKFLELPMINKILFLNIIPFNAILHVLSFRWSTNHGFSF